jgi:hypothetical protein
MRTKLPPQLIDLIYDALVKSFWRKGTLRTFLRRSGISENFLVQLDSGESKRAWLDRLFPKLEAAEKGPAVILQMARTLAGQKSFPDLEDWEDSAAKIQAATASVGALRRYLASREEDPREARERELSRKRAAEIREASLRSQANLKKIRERLDALSSLLGTPSGEEAFEDWFYDLMDFSEVEYGLPYYASGRQMAGSVALDGITYMVELKFTAAQADATEVDSLLEKVHTKSENLMGIMVSMSGFSHSARQQASFAKSPLLLLDYSHLYLILAAVQSFPEVIRRVRRHSSQTGRAYLSTTEFAGSK